MSFPSSRMRSVVHLLLLILSCKAFRSSSRSGNKFSSALYAREVVIFGPNNLRLHDNPCLLSTDGKPIIPVIINSQGGISSTEAECNLRSKLESMGAIVSEFTAPGDISSFVSTLLHETEIINEGVTITYCKSAVEPAASLMENIISHISGAHGSVNCIGLWDNLVTLDVNNANSPNLHYDEFVEQYKPYSLDAIEPVMLPKILFDPKFCRVVPENVPKDISISSGCCEDRALQLLSEYLKIGDQSFSCKYGSTYASDFSRTEEHKESMMRLTPQPSESGKNSTYSNFFQGEVISAILAPMLAMGCLSPRLLLYPNNLLAKGDRGAFPEFPFVNRIRQEAVRRDWHCQLARANIVHRNREDGWDMTYRNWRGYIQREGVMVGTESEDNTAAPQKPLAFVLHGFGGSMEQFTSFAAELSRIYTVISFDSLGFGYSEKPPLSYNQYLWRDQAVEYVIRECKARGETSIVLMGNSIGGFTVASVAAELANLAKRGEANVKCTGLVLLNSAGRILESAGREKEEERGEGRGTAVEQALFPAYKGPPSEALRVFGSLVFSVLQPKIEQMLVWLYPSNPTRAKQGLAGNILRDSQDPGASDVIAAGGKLPTPRSMNDLFVEYDGPVLIAQGSLDPLNDAVARAKSFEDIRAGISVELMPLGHCPMDENPKMVVAGVTEWATREDLIAGEL